MSSTDLRGKVALVTGGGRGIGAAVARRLSRAGADVALTYRSSEAGAAAVVDSINDTGSRAAAFQADQSDVAAVAQMVSDVAAHFGRIDILVNNAGVFQSGALGATDPHGITDLWATTVTGMVATTGHAVKHMGEGGRVVLVSSIAAARATLPGFGDYGAAKAAVEGYGRGWARDLAPQGITVNTVQIGFTRTDMAPPEDSDMGRAMLEMIALHRYAEVDEIANVIAFLVGPESTYMTGSLVRVDGGWNA